MIAERRKLLLKLTERSVSVKEKQGRVIERRRKEEGKTQQRKKTAKERRRLRKEEKIMKVRNKVESAGQSFLHYSILTVDPVSVADRQNHSC